MFVLDVADDFLQHVFEREKPKHFSFAVADDRHWPVRLAEQPERVGDRFVRIEERRGVERVFEHDRAEIRRAGLLYLVATHAATLALIGLFALWGSGARDLTFDALAARAPFLPAHGSGVIALAMIGFGLKAGIVPLHFWLPEAHAAAPSHVSALMSGVVIKTGIYGLLRVAALLGSPPAWWGWVLRSVGAVVGAWGGVLLALYGAFLTPLRVSGVTIPQPETPPFTPVVTAQLSEGSGNAVGFNVGVDWTYMLTPRFGAGGFARFSGGPTADVSAGDQAVDVRVGGFQIGAGIRIRFKGEPLLP